MEIRDFRGEGKSPRPEGCEEKAGAVWCDLVRKRSAEHPTTNIQRDSQTTRLQRASQAVLSSIYIHRCPRHPQAHTPEPIRTQNGFSPAPLSPSRLSPPFPVQLNHPSYDHFTHRRRHPIRRGLPVHASQPRSRRNGKVARLPAAVRPKATLREIAWRKPEGQFGLRISAFFRAFGLRSGGQTGEKDSTEKLPLNEKATVKKTIPDVSPSRNNAL